MILGIGTGEHSRTENTANICKLHILLPVNHTNTVDRISVFVKKLVE